jgi:hypothetical protein
MHSEHTGARSMYALITPDASVYLTPGPPVHRHALAPGVVVVEITRSGEPPQFELTADYERAPDVGDVVRHALIEWAGATGHIRLWLPNEIVDLSESLVPIGGEVTCAACGAAHREVGMDFMQMVITHGAFPTVCPCCAGRLPQWRPLGQSVGDRRMARAG